MRDLVYERLEREQQRGFAVSAYSKFIAAIVGTVLSAIVAALTDNTISDVEWINIAIIGVGAAAVFTAPNVPGAKFTKSILAVLTAVLTLLVNVIADGISTAEWLQLGIAALAALGVYQLPNRDPETGANLADSLPYVGQHVKP